MIQILQNQIINDFIKKNFDSIVLLKKDLKINVDLNTILIQIKLHLPLYQEIQLANESISIIKHILEINMPYFREYEKFHNIIFKKYEKLLYNSKLKGKNKLYLVLENGNKLDILFKKISNKNIDYIFQNNLHYIKRYRKDTYESYGIFLNNDEYPICYASLSISDRTYLSNALIKLNIIQDTDEYKALTMTRAFGFNGIPKNMMSKLFDKIYKTYKNNDLNFILTALNPMVGFQGSIFKGSSYFIFATSPMEYKYDKNGLYLNRRSSINKQIIKQNIQTPPIVWFGRGLKKYYQEKLENNKNIYNISKEEYNNE